MEGEDQAQEGNGEQEQGCTGIGRGRGWGRGWGQGSVAEVEQQPVGIGRGRGRGAGYPQNSTKTLIVGKKKMVTRGKNKKLPADMQ
mgnify:CR=1 FL=1